MKRALPFLFLAFALPAQAQDETQDIREISSIKAKIPVPKGWHLKETTAPDGSGSASILVTEEKIETDFDSVKTGLTLEVIREIPQRMEGMKPSEYAKTIAEQIAESEDGAKVVEGKDGDFATVEVAQEIEGDEMKLYLLHLLKANDASGTLYYFTWQTPVDSEGAVDKLGRKLIKDTIFDPNY